MKLSSTVASLLVTDAAAAAIPEAALRTSLQARQDTGSYTVFGLGSRKQQVTSSGADSFNLAIAMLETEQWIRIFGIFKQNWGMMRVCCNRFKGQAQSDWNNGAVLNSELVADVQCLKDCQSHYGRDKWLAGHRNGESGLNNLNTQDIRNYIDGVKYIEQQLLTQPDGLTNDVRSYMYVVPI